MKPISAMRVNYIWRKRANANWLVHHEPEIADASGGAYAIIKRPGKTRSIVEIYCTRKRQTEQLRARFGGTASPSLSIRVQAQRPVKIGNHLTIVGERSRRHDTNVLVIPAGIAFGTGEHPTTAMSLRILEHCSRSLCNWNALDVGTGSGILALAAARFGARKVIAIDHDQLAIKTARANAAANKITQSVEVIRGDARRPPRGRQFDIITANLFSELLIEALPRWTKLLRPNGRLILSGILRAQECDVVRGLSRMKIQPLEIRRRGKWIAILAARKCASPRVKSGLKSHLRQLGSGTLFGGLGFSCTHAV